MLILDELTQLEVHIYDKWNHYEELKYQSIGCMHFKVAHFQRMLNSLKIHTIVLKWQSILMSLI
jgi:hypothetical protein